MSRNKETKIILYCLVFCSLKYLFLWKCFEVSHGTWWKTILKKRWVLRMRNQTSDLWIPPSNALPLSHRDSTVSEVFYKVHMTCILHTSRISNVDSVMFVDRNSRDGKFWAWKRNKKDVFVLSRAWDKEKILCPHEESNLRPLDSMLQCSTTEQQTLRSARSITKFIWHMSSTIFHIESQYLYIM